jgi:hypothetical protein
MHIFEIGSCFHLNLCLGKRNIRIYNKSFKISQQIDLLEENAGDGESQKADDEEYLIEADKDYKEEGCEEYNEDGQEDGLASDQSSSELLDDDNRSSNHHDGDKVEYLEEEYDDIACCVQNRDLNICQMTEMPPSCHVKTSAVMGVGLQELLQLIDQKLEEQINVVQRSYGPFDRKWRPSFSETSSDQ